MDDRRAIAYLRHRRATYFFGSLGPPLPPGMAARWHVTPEDPRGWHANMVGFVEGPEARLGEVLRIGVDWMSRRGADTWLDADEFTPLFRHEDLIAQYGFTLRDDWNAMVCRSAPALETNPRVQIVEARTRDEILTAAWIAAQADHAESIDPQDAQVRQRQQRYWREYVRRDARFVLATLDGVPAGTARRTFEDLPVIVGVATLPEARRQGVGTAITAALLREAIADRGVCALYTQRDSVAERIYTRLGFASLFRTRAWVRPLRSDGDE